MRESVRATVPPVRALVRSVGVSLAKGALTFMERQPVALETARQQHGNYVAALERVGAEVQVLPPLDDFPDAVFVEDPVLVLDECAILLPMGSPGRRGEGASLEAPLAPHRPVRHLPLPGTLEGGDVLRIGRDLYVGHSTRTTPEGIHRLREVVEPLGYRVIAVKVTGCLHLKTGCTWVGRHLLMNSHWVDPEPFAQLPRLEVPEPWAANTLTLGDTVLVAAGFPSTEALLARHGYRVAPVDISEFQKLEAGVTCLSVIFLARPPGKSP